jgi:hypothetical protein
MFGRLLTAGLLVGALVCPAWAENDKSRARARSVETAFAVTAAVPDPSLALITSRDRFAAYTYFREEFQRGTGRPAW